MVHLKPHQGSLGGQTQVHYMIDACHNAFLKIHKCSSSGEGSAGAFEGDHKMEEHLIPSTVMKEIFSEALLSQVKCLVCKGEIQ